MRFSLGSIDINIGTASEKPFEEPVRESDKEAPAKIDSPEPPSLPNSEHSVRTSSYDGILRKCPSCGAVINPTEAHCSTCGYQVTGRATCNSVQEFSRQYLEIEKSRRKNGTLDNLVDTFLGTQADSIEEQKIALITLFPVPNAVEEISEFMLMAASNINVELSKKSLFSNKVNNAQKRLSDAWVSKMQQVYRKAQLSFPNDPVFSMIKNIYEDKMRELKLMK